MRTFQVGNIRNTSILVNTGLDFFLNTQISRMLPLHSRHLGDSHFRHRSSSKADVHVQDEATAHHWFLPNHKSLMLAGTGLEFVLVMGLTVSSFLRCDLTIL
jgi:hypothetical protein